MSVIPDKVLFPRSTCRYGRYDPEYGEVLSYWFCLEDYSILEETKLLEKLGYESAEQLNNDTFFIPVWKTNITDLKKEFLNGKGEYRSYIEEIEKIRQDYTKFQKHHMPWYECSFSQAFNMFFNDGYPGGPVWDEWERYMDERLRSDFVAWCEKYHIRYEKDGRYLTCAGVAGKACYDPEYGNFNDYWFSFKDYILYSEDRIMSDYDYGTVSQIKASGLFVRVFRLDISKLKKEFLESHKEYRHLATEIENFRIDCTKYQQNRVPDYECTYSYAFNMYINPYTTLEKEPPAVWKAWENFKAQRLITAFVAWCEENNIWYKKPTDQDIPSIITHSLIRPVGYPKNKFPRHPKS